MNQVKKIEAKSVARMLGILYAVFGLVAGIFLFVLFVFIGVEDDLTQVEALIFGFGAPVALPVMYGIFGYIGGYIVAWIYNAIAAKFGGIKIELEQSSTDEM